MTLQQMELLIGQMRTEIAYLKRALVELTGKPLPHPQPPQY